MTTHTIPYIKFLLNFTISYSSIQVRYLLIQPLVKVSMHFSQTAPITDGEARYELCSGRTGNAGKIQDIRVTAMWKRYKQTAWVMLSPVSVTTHFSCSGGAVNTNLSCFCGPSLPHKGTGNLRTHSWKHQDSIQKPHHYLKYVLLSCL